MKTKYLTKEEAIELSIKKWEWIVNNKGILDTKKLLLDIPELKNIKNNCGLCELHLHHGLCINCPLDIIEGDIVHIGCQKDGHPENEWFNKQNTSTAKKVLKLIRSLKCE